MYYYLKIAKKVRPYTEKRIFPSILSQKNKLKLLKIKIISLINLIFKNYPFFI